MKYIRNFNNTKLTAVVELTSTTGFLGLALGATVGTGFGGVANKSSSSSANKLSPEITIIGRSAFKFSDLIRLKEKCNN